MNESSEKNRENSIDGFVVIDKPKGPTSHQVDYWVRQILDVEKVGHIGTLDPNATGVLVMAIGKAVKLIDVAHEYPKEYVTVMRLYGDFGRDQLEAAFDQFKGEIYQLPPMKSAVARALRIRRIYELEIKEVQDRLVLYRVKCESGTYIRTLCIDIGYVLGPGAQMAELRRTATGPFDESMIHTLQELSDAAYMSKNGDPSRLQGMIIPMLELFRNDPKIVVKRTTLSNIAHGSDLFPGGIRAITGKPMKGDRVAVVTEDNELVGTGKMLVNYDSIMDLKVVDFDRILLENPDQKPAPAVPVIREPPRRPSSTYRNNSGGGQRRRPPMRNDRRPQGKGSYGRKRER
ncbi:MAG: hypothetical protein AMDU1_APLC00020G0032 [Thermoplasmatales archaeon A-plasma]|jgi:tRNA pseudouridine55 synthase/H/ACA ribonucleoprotein complex subunit 4|nr:MAG: hypothetical protein AMDU1_APLC00020G0032 [Thermoplasmatales archaeon A-plasma]WMT43975.1 MAG: RNA-guided pseudouridylation complex pseudouridine synthase subunit Cbf5 [Cuniculiplasma divulgatum]